MYYTVMEAPLWLQSGDPLMGRAAPKLGPHGGSTEGRSSTRLASHGRAESSTTQGMSIVLKMAILNLSKPQRKTRSCDKWLQRDAGSPLMIATEPSSELCGCQFLIKPGAS